MSYYLYIYEKANNKYMKNYGKNIFISSKLERK